MAGNLDGIGLGADWGEGWGDEIFKDDSGRPSRPCAVCKGGIMII